MRRMVMFAVVLLVCGVSARAQSSYPKAEIFGGYSYLNVEGDEGIAIFDRQHLHGIGFSLAGNLSRKIGITGDFSYNVKNNIEVGPFGVDLNAFYFLIGPRLSWRGEKATVFGHALAGGVRLKTHVKGFGADRETDFAMGFGGGVDVRVNKMIAIRAFQGDYLPTRVDAAFGGLKWAHHFRAQAGVVLTLGGD